MGGVESSQFGSVGVEPAARRHPRVFARQQPVQLQVAVEGIQAERDGRGRSQQTGPARAASEEDDGPAPAISTNFLLFNAMPSWAVSGVVHFIGVIILALINRRLSWKLLRQAMDTTAKLSSFVVFILVGSTVFSLVFRSVNGTSGSTAPLVSITVPVSVPA